MAEKKKKKLTIKEQKKLAYVKSKIFWACKSIATPAPLAITMIVKRDEWFNQDYKVAIGGTSAIVILAVVSLLVNKKTEDKTITNTWITMIAGLLVFAFVFYMISQISYDIWWLCLVAASGCVAGYGVDILEQMEVAKYNKFKKALDSSEEDLLKEQAKRETQKVSVD